MTNDDDLIDFDENGLILPPGSAEGRVDNAGASIWYADYAGAGAPVLLLHGGLGNAGNLGKQVPALRNSGYRVIAIDSRGHGRSSRDATPYSYQLMASDVIAILDQLGIAKAAIVGWSDGADTGLVMAHDTPERVSALVFFACNVDSSGTKPFVFTDTLGHCISRHQKDYAVLSPAPGDWEAFSEAVGLMQRTQPNYTADDLRAVRVPVLSVLGEHDEFITVEHARYIADTVASGKFLLLPGVSHFAPIQRPELFNAAIVAFLSKQLSS